MLAASIPLLMGHPIVEDELALLARVQAALERGPRRARPSEGAILAEMERLRDQLLSGRGADDRGAASAELNRQEALLQQLRESKTAPLVSRESPYFGHLRLREAAREWDICIGKATFIEGGVNVVDWRNAPISRVFYRYREGDEYEELIAGRRREGEVAARRTVTIRDGRLLRVDAAKGSFELDPQAIGGWRQSSRDTPRLSGAAAALIHSADSGAIARFGGDPGGPRRADKHLPEIAALIDPDQFALITRAASGLVVIRGGAGSGKTTVALHRIAFLAYDDPDIDSPRTLVLLFSRALRDYVAHVLPALGIDRVHVATFREWAYEQRRALFPQLPVEVSDDAPSDVLRLLQHPAMLAAVDAQIRRVAGPATARQVIDDWGSVLGDSTLIAAAVDSTASVRLERARLERACAWARERHARLQAWLAGDRALEVALCPEDDALLLRTWQRRVGPLRDRRGAPLRYRHVAIDEVQDFSPLEIRVLLDCLDERHSMTLAGDTQQHVLQDAGFTSWREFFRHLDVAGTEVETLRISYRSTREIVHFGLAVLGPLREDDDVPLTTRAGQPVEIFRFTDHGACVAFLAQALRQLERDEPLASVALLTPSATLSRLYYDGLRVAEVSRLALVQDQRYSFAPGVEITEVQEVKGLEFDYVVLVEVSTTHYPETAAARRLLHVGATRAIHQLWLTSVATPSRLVREALDAAAAPY